MQSNPVEGVGFQQIRLYSGGKALRVRAGARATGSEKDGFEHIGFGSGTDALFAKHASGIHFFLGHVAIGKRLLNRFVCNAARDVCLRAVNHEHRLFDAATEVVEALLGVGVEAGGEERERRILQLSAARVGKALVFAKRIVDAIGQRVGSAQCSRARALPGKGALCAGGKACGIGHVIPLQAAEAPKHRNLRQESKRTQGAGVAERRVVVERTRPPPRVIDALPGATAFAVAVAGVERERVDGIAHQTAGRVAFAHAHCE